MINKTKNQFNSIYNFISNNRDLLYNAISEELLELTGDKFKEKLENIVSKDGVLRIGVVGQVKAGKSSFINALLFDGKDILPKASTPMTAALTVIKYSQKPFAEVEFYSKADWEIIKRKAKDFEEALEKTKKEFNSQNIVLTEEEIKEYIKINIGESITSAYELYQMAKDSNLDINAYIGKKKIVSENIDFIVDLVDKLQNYIGVNGKFTPITKSTILYLNIPILKEIEIIDTPGTNDPIISRGQTTREFLSQCDAVFLLSTSSQFMGREDAEFLINTLPAEGISDIIILGSKFDSVLLDEHRKYKGNIKLALKDLYNRLSSQAEDSLKNIISNNFNKPIIERIKDKKIKFISGICYNIAKKDLENLNEIEKHILNRLEKSYKIKFTKDILFQLANIDSIREKDLQEIKIRKDEILNNKLKSFILGQKSLVINNLTYLESDLKNRINELVNSDIRELRDKAKKLEIGFNRAKVGIEQIFIDFKLDIHEKLHKLVNEISNEKLNYINIDKDQRSKEIFSHSTGWWLWRKEHHKIVYFDIANVNDAVDKAIQFIKLINNSVLNNWDKMINIKDIEFKLIEETSNAFDLESIDFNKNQIIYPIKNALRKVVIAPYKVDERKYIDKITSAFSKREVQDLEVYKLEALLREVLFDINDDMSLKIKEKIDEISNILDENSKTFISSIKEYSNQNISQLKEALKDKENSIINDKRLFKEIQNLKIGLLE